MRYGARLRDLLDTRDPLVSVAVHDPLTASVVERTGEIDALVLSGSGASFSRAGLPDMGLLTMSEMVSHTRNVQERVDLPVVADADDGYGGPGSVVRTVREFAATGVGGILLEDQARPKRHGYDANKRVLPREEAIGRLRVALEARDERDPSMVVIGRTDATAAVNGSLEEAIARANAFGDVGADLVYVQGPQSMSEVRRVAEAVEYPQMYEGADSSPRLDVEEAAEFGFNLLHYARGVTYATVLAVEEYIGSLTVEGTPAFEALEATFGDSCNDLQALAGREPFREIERAVEREGGTRDSLDGPA
jgi:2-methylisocitrate lyase-like PEP mutase family enzyme